MKRFIIDVNVFNVQLRIHWSFPLTFLFNFFVSGPIYVYALSMTSLILILVIHELGHAFIAHHFGYNVASLDFYFNSGKCSIYSVYDVKHELFIFFGGIIAQIILLIFSFSLLNILNYLGIPHTNYFYQINLYMLIYYNIFIILFNLIPLDFLDGGKIFQAIKQLLYCNFNKIVTFYFRKIANK